MMGMGAETGGRGAAREAEKAKLKKYTPISDRV